MGRSATVPFAINGENHILCGLTMPTSGYTNKLRSIAIDINVEPYQSILLYELDGDRIRKVCYYQYRQSPFCFSGVVSALCIVVGA